MAYSNTRDRWPQGGPGSTGRGESAPGRKDQMVVGTGSLTSKWRSSAVTGKESTPYMRKEEPTELFLHSHRQYSTRLSVNNAGVGIKRAAPNVTAWLKPHEKDVERELQRERELQMEREEQHRLQEEDEWKKLLRQYQEGEKKIKKRETETSKGGCYPQKVIRKIQKSKKKEREKYDFNKISDRLDSFLLAPSYPDIDKQMFYVQYMASNNFVFTGFDKKVKCISCNDMVDAGNREQIDKHISLHNKDASASQAAASPSASPDWSTIYQRQTTFTQDIHDWLQRNCLPDDAELAKGGFYATAIIRATSGAINGIQVQCYECGDDAIVTRQTKSVGELHNRKTHCPRVEQVKERGTRFKHNPEANITVPPITDPFEALSLSSSARNTGESSRAKQPSAEIEDNTCVICLEAERTHTVIPCGHKMYCETCVSHLTECAMCREPVKSSMKIYG
ncbi:hypothetical protein M3P05_17910 [Sansalvadorimonas sp. 2012CJ34-2]|uniref:RING-type domain-containing protein n=1 Tax=Parendozoicomonas callyspongiae TaxID=2942213 RepID=A0ABT0PMU5_9GAMM|nr:RING finger protein [Sansalvadorimonas sp. 2012CJ34-2]MCL6271798.1 hypothetical protein [Sansalvadorimonas sp. 2012CJ34-2]